MATKEHKLIKNQPGKHNIRSGFCNNGHHEGMRPVNHRGIPLKTCPLYLTCGCSCHKELDDMYAMSDLPRILITNPDFHVEPSHFVRPDAAEVLRMKNDRLIAEGKKPISEAGIEDVLAGKAFDPTASGYRARGQLEYQVFVACSQLCWPTMMTEITPITPKFIAEYIAKHEGIEAPSSGAIQACWDRWVLYGIATYAKGPVRFTGFIDFDERPTVADFDEAKTRYKQKQKHQTASDRRTKIQGLRRK